MRNIFSLINVAMLSVLLLGMSTGVVRAEDAVPAINSGDTAWMLISTALVIMMSIPGLALFYGGLTRSKNMLSILAQVFVIFSLMTLLWAVYGYTLTFEGGNSVIGSWDKLFLKGITPDTVSGTIPEYVFVAFQSAFAAITVALIVGSFAERVRFSAVLIFGVIWFTFCYIPVAHMIWGSEGILFKEGALDFAGGTVIHINAGVAGLVGAYVIGKRAGLGRVAMTPHSLTLTMVGASMLWVGWFGFNGGSALGANGTAALAFVNTILGAGSAVLSWIAVEAMIKGKASMLGAVSGAVAGLVAITPACGFVGPMGSIIIGLSAGVVCLWGVTGLKKLLAADDSFDVFGIHGVGGILGGLLTAVFASGSLGGVKGADYAVMPQLVVQAKGMVITIVISAVVAWMAYKIADKLVGLRVSADEEREGLDLTSHGEKAYSD